MAEAVAVLVLLACLGLALMPLLLGGGGEDDSAEAADRRELLQKERERLVDEIREVDLDLAMGKVTEKDHAALRARLEAQAMSTIAALRELEAGEPGADEDAPAEAPGEESEGRA